MKNNKMALILAALLLLSCAACGKTETPPAGNDPAQETPDTPRRRILRRLPIPPHSPTRPPPTPPSRRSRSSPWRPRSSPIGTTARKRPSPVRPG